MALSAAKLNTYSMVASQNGGKQLKGTPRTKSPQSIETFKPSAQQQASLKEIGGIRKSAINTYQSSLKLSHGTMFAHEVPSQTRLAKPEARSRGGLDAYAKINKTISGEPRPGSLLNQAA